MHYTCTELVTSAQPHAYTYTRSGSSDLVTSSEHSTTALSAPSIQHPTLFCTRIAIQSHVCAFDRAPV
eukprot:7390839-Prymnesium_polylepis.2